MKMLLIFYVNAKINLEKYMRLRREDYPEDGVIIKAYFLKTTEFVEQIPEIEQTLKNLSTFDIPLGKFQFVVNDVDDEEWATAWKSIIIQFKSLTGSRLYQVGNHTPHLLTK
ncbi:hypothetical protein GCM10027614_83600 [Micromonospora vulcania]